MKPRLYPDPRPRQVSGNLKNQLLLVSGKLLLANLCSRDPTSTSPGVCARISNASSCLPGSVLQCSLSWRYCFVEVVPSVSNARLRTRRQEWPLDC